MTTRTIVGYPPPVTVRRWLSCACPGCWDCGPRQVAFLGVGPAGIGFCGGTGRMLARRTRRGVLQFIRLPRGWRS